MPGRGHPPTEELPPPVTAVSRRCPPPGPGLCLQRASPRRRCGRWLRLRSLLRGRSRHRRLASRRLAAAPGRVAHREARGAVRRRRNRRRRRSCRQCRSRLAGRRARRRRRTCRPRVLRSTRSHSGMRRSKCDWRRRGVPSRGRRRNKRSSCPSGRRTAATSHSSQCTSASSLPEKRRRPTATARRDSCATLSVSNSSTTAASWNGKWRWPGCAMMKDHLLLADDHHAATNPTALLNARA